jgi:hypothetical protein
LRPVFGAWPSREKWKAIALRPEAVVDRVIFVTETSRIFPVSRSARRRFATALARCLETRPVWWRLFTLRLLMAGVSGTAFDLANSGSPRLPGTPFVDIASDVNHVHFVSFWSVLGSRTRRRQPHRNYAKYLKDRRFLASI